MQASLTHVLNENLIFFRYFSSHRNEVEKDDNILKYGH